MTVLQNSQCPLCGGREADLFTRDKHHCYQRCPDCDLVYVPTGERPDPLSEKSSYDRHDKNTADGNYGEVLSRLTGPLLARLAPGSIGLDFGSGPGPLLAGQMREAGMRVRTFDVFYDPDDSVWYQSYDFITCSDVLEHLHSPGRELDRLFSVLKPGGWLGIMTRRYDHDTGLARDNANVTQVCFFSDASLQWLARRQQAELMLLEDDVALLQKPGN